jgi:hypothetical protein
MKTAHVLLLLSGFAASPASAQVLTTADTLGKGAQSVFVSENRLFIDGARLHVAIGQYVRGVTDRVDVYLLAGHTRTDDQTGTVVQGQTWIGGGGNWRVGRWQGFSVSLFGVASVPLNRRDQACRVLLNPALIVSRAVVRDRLALYTSLNAVLPVGKREQGWFTPTKNEINVPAGAMLMLGRWAVFAEADLGHLKALALGVARTF